MNLLRDALYVTSVTMLLSACTALASSNYTEIAKEPRNVDVLVSKDPSGECQANITTLGPKDDGGQACSGIGKADGVACGRGGDTIKWIGLGQVTLTSIEFTTVAPGDVCAGGGSLNGPVFQCTLNEQSAPKVYKYVLKYKYQTDPECSIDPYIIINNQ